MPTAIPSPLQLREFYVTHTECISLSRSQQPSLLGAECLDIAVALGELKDVPDLLGIRLTIRTRNDEFQGRLPYAVHLVIEGYFSCADGKKESESHPERDRLLLVNGATILYGIARSHIAQVAALGPSGKWILPPANLWETMLRDQPKQVKDRKKRGGTKKK